MQDAGEKKESSPHVMLTPQKEGERGGRGELQAAPEKGIIRLGRRERGGTSASLRRGKCIHPYRLERRELSAFSAEKENGKFGVRVEGEEPRPLAGGGTPACKKRKKGEETRTRGLCKNSVHQGRRKREKRSGKREKGEKRRKKLISNSCSKKNWEWGQSGGEIGFSRKGTRKKIISQAFFCLLIPVGRPVTEENWVHPIYPIERGPFPARRME